MSAYPSQAHLIRCLPILRRIVDSHPTPILISNTDPHDPATFTQYTRTAIRAYITRPDWRGATNLPNTALKILKETEICRTPSGKIFLGPRSLSPRNPNFTEEPPTQSSLLLRESKLVSPYLHYLLSLLSQEVINIPITIHNPSPKFLATVKQLVLQHEFEVVIHQEGNDLRLM